MKRNWILVTLLLVAAGCASHKTHHTTHQGTTYQGAEMSASQTSGRQTGTVTVGEPSQYSVAAVTLRQDMRKLWTDHVVWTRCYIIAALGDQPDAQAAANRLMRNQDDLGNAVAKYYGQRAGQQL